LSASVSVIVPALNEAARIDSHIAHVLKHAPLEVIVADGGSKDETRGLAAAAGARVVSAPIGRGPQMQAGALAAQGDILLFLHADTTLQDGAFDAIRAALADARISGGSFRLSFDAPGVLLNFYASMTRFDSMMTTFGDSAMFMRRADFHRSGGFPDWPILEDVAFRRAILRIGRFKKLPLAVVTSARRFQRRGVIMTQMRNAAIMAAYCAGVSPHRLARWYGHEPAPSRSDQEV
jgi:rSAM/selenodomain-associated transferase 2